MIRRIFTFLYRYLLGAGACLYLLTIGVFRADRREILHEVLFRLGWRRRPPPEPVGPPLLIPAIRAGDILPAESSLRLVEPDTVSGNVSSYELVVISALVSVLKPKACFEIGTFDGRTTVNLAANGPADGRVYTLDLPPDRLDKTRLAIDQGDAKFILKDESGARFKNTPWAARITQLYGDSAAFDFTPYEAKMDFVFVDGSHSYEYVKSDTRAALRLLKPDRGVILWHDYGSPYWKGLTEALNELMAEIPELATMRHVQDTMLVYWRRGKP